MMQCFMTHSAKKNSFKIDKLCFVRKYFEVAAEQLADLIPITTLT